MDCIEVPSWKGFYWISVKKISFQIKKVLTVFNHVLVTGTKKGYKNFNTHVLLLTWIVSYLFDLSNIAQISIEIQVIYPNVINCTSNLRSLVWLKKMIKISLRVSLHGINSCESTTILPTNRNSLIKNWPWEASLTQDWDLSKPNSNHENTVIFMLF